MDKKDPRMLKNLRNRSIEQLATMIVIGVCSIAISIDKAGIWHALNFYSGLGLLTLTIFIITIKFIKFE